MTMIAEQADASIGALYDYFPDKKSLAQTLLDQYSKEAIVTWVEPLERQPAPSKAELAGLFVEAIIRFAESRPGYLPLLGAPITHIRTPEARLEGRRAIARGLQKIDPSLSDDRGFLAAQVVVELLKGLLSVYRQVTPDRRETVAEEFKKLMRFYLSEALTDRPR
jgi:AcrR family transcriptional regulator